MNIQEKSVHEICTNLYDSPCGELIIGSYGDKLCLCNWTHSKRRDVIDRRLKTSLEARYVYASSDIIQETVRQLDEYFAGKRIEFDVPLLFAGTEFQRRVWHKLMEIQWGTTVSYGEFARMVGSPTAVRAVAAANGVNAISIFVPCHRVVGSDGSLTGYGGGLEAKRFLLDLERK